MGAEAALTIRTMRADEVDFAIELAAREGWNPGLHDAACFHRADPGGFLMGLLGDRPIGCISAVSYAGGFGFIGLYIVEPEFRGRGHGMALWRAAMARLAGHNIGLDGVVAQQDNYRKSGFTLAYQNVRYEGRAGSAAGSAEALTDAREVPFARLGEFDRLCFPAERRSFLEGWLKIPGASALARVDHGAIRGYGVIRPSRRGWKIGPLFADDAATARHLFHGLCAHVAADDVVVLDVPMVNPDAVALAKEHGMNPVFETARMYTGAPPAVAMPRIFGVTTFELG